MSLIFSVKNVSYTVATVQMFLEGHDDSKADRNSFIDGCVGAALECTYLCAGLVKTKEELLGPATTNDEENDEIDDLIPFTRNPPKKTTLIEQPWEEIWN